MTANVELTLNPTIALADAGAASPTTTDSASGMENGYYRAKPTPGPRLAAVGCGVLALVSAAAVGGVFVGRATKDDGKGGGGGGGSMPPAEHKSGITSPSFAASARWRGGAVSHHSTWPIRSRRRREMNS